MRTTLGLLLLAAALLFRTGPAFAQEPATAGAGQEEALAITADRLEAEADLDRLTFSGSVVARQGGVTIYARELTVTYGADRQVEQATASGDVRIVQGERVATAEQARLLRAERRIVLTGRPRVHQGEDFIEGEEIIVFLDERRSIVNSGGESRVNAVFHPAEKP